jgi:hypothetical protein
MTTVTFYAIEICGQYYNRILDEFTDLSRATLYEKENPEDIKLFEKDRKQLLDLGLKTHNSTVKLAS